MVNIFVKRATGLLVYNVIFIVGPKTNLKNDPRCVCGHLFEDAIHFFLECPLHQHDRTSLFNYFNNIVPISIEYILFGCNEITN